MFKSPGCLEDLVRNSWNEYLSCGNGINRALLSFVGSNMFLRVGTSSVFGFIKNQIKEKYDRLVEIQKDLASGLNGVSSFG